jgi:hypothetical protein
MMFAAHAMSPMPLSIVFHPAFQSLLLPALLGGLCALALHRALGRAHRSWGAFGASFGLVLAMLWWPGFVWPAASHAQKLPWIVLCALLAALAAQVFLPVRAAPPDRATGAATRRARGVPMALLVLVLLVALSSGLAFIAVAGGSLLLAQLALMVAASAGVPLLWAWARPDSGPRITAIALVPLVAALIALLVMVAALGWPTPGPAQAPGSGADDPYYTPRW